MPNPRSAAPIAALLCLTSSSAALAAPYQLTIGGNLREPIASFPVACHAEAESAGAPFPIVFSWKDTAYRIHVECDQGLLTSVCLEEVTRWTPAGPAVQMSKVDAVAGEIHVTQEHWGTWFHTRPLSVDLVPKEYPESR